MTSYLRMLVALIVVLVSSTVARVQAPGPGQKSLSPGLTPKAEEAIRRGLAFLASSQHKDGSWGRNHQVANTSLALLAFMVKGHMPERPPYGAPMARGVDYLLRRVRLGSGYMGKSMYEHGLATLALSELWGMSSRGDEIRAALKKAVTVILRAQNREGGWRYHPQPTGADISVTVMQVVALASYQEAGGLVPNRTIERAVRYVKSLQARNGGFGYRHPSRPGFARTAAGVVSLQLAGAKRSKAVERGLEYLRAAPAKKFSNLPDSKWYYYGHYYAAVAMFLQEQGESREGRASKSLPDFAAWYPHIREGLLARQNKNGSWKGEDHGTPMAILILGLPYRFLPIYQR